MYLLFSSPFLCALIKSSIALWSLFKLRKTTAMLHMIGLNEYFINQDRNYKNVIIIIKFGISIMKWTSFNIKYLYVHTFRYFFIGFSYKGILMIIYINMPLYEMRDCRVAIACLLTDTSYSAGSNPTCPR